MDDAELARLDAAVANYARWRAVSDPAIEPRDLIQSAWLRVLPVLASVATEEERVALLKWAIARAALDLHRKAGLRQREPFGEWLEGPQRVEDQALATAALRPILDRAAAGDRPTLSLLAIGLGYTWAEVKAGVGVSTRALHGWHCARAELLA